MAAAAGPFVRTTLSSKALHFSIEEVQSRMLLRDPDALDLRYTRTMMGFLRFLPAPRSIAMIGLGGGSLAKFCRRHRPGARIDVVEVNRDVVALRDEFCVPPDGPRFRVVVADGASFVGNARCRYDVLMLDAFGPDGLPRSMATPRFYGDCADTLEAGGVLVANLHSAAGDFDACVRRLGRAFAQVPLVVTDREAGNSIAFVRKGAPLAGVDTPAPLRPPGFDAAAWASLRGAFERIATALARPRTEAER